jgi:hypothetical protein
MVLNGLTTSPTESALLVPLGYIRFKGMIGAEVEVRGAMTQIALSGRAFL